MAILLGAVAGLVGAVGDAVGNVSAFDLGALGAGITNAIVGAVAAGIEVIGAILAALG